MEVPGRFTSEDARNRHSTEISYERPIELGEEWPKMEESWSYLIIMQYAYL